MIGSGIFIVSADMARQVGSAGWLLAVWVITGVLTLIAALSYGELAAMMPAPADNTSICAKPTARCGDSSMAGPSFWSSKRGTIAAVAVAFARFLGVLVPQLSDAQTFSNTDDSACPRPDWLPLPWWCCSPGPIQPG